MNTFLRRRSVGLAVLSLLAVSACDRSADRAIPDVICGTRIDPGVTRPLLTTTGGLSEYDRVDRSAAVTAPCLVLAQDLVAMRFRFSWDADAADLMYLAQDTGKVSRVSAPRYLSGAPYKTLVGTDGAISQAACKTKGGKYFTLTFQLPQVKLTDQSHRTDIEKFMRAYFPATVKTLGCA
ncbi:hypothetical protein ACIRU2_01015 [Streptomyces sp. NPDC101169]|uniref:hypothetical protein n=1 Tax=Streptomyces sp. NPDC101169 TaxID=3366121 RepID=UPI003827019A